VNARRTSIPSAVTIARFSTPARMISPKRVKRRKACSPASTSSAAAISIQRSFGIDAPRTWVVRDVQRGSAYSRESLPQIPSISAIVASESPTVTSTCSMWRR
jgi:hypothetical protein